MNRHIVKNMLSAALTELPKDFTPELNGDFKPDDLHPPPMPEGCERDPRQDPRIGDMLHVRVLKGAKRPNPMTVIDVTKYKVYWQRAGARYNTDIRFWKSNWVIQHAEILAVAP